MTAIHADELETLESPQALDELDDESERFISTVLDDKATSMTTSGRMKKRHVPRERDAELEDPEGWVGVFGRGGELY